MSSVIQVVVCTDNDSSFENYTNRYVQGGLPAEVYSRKGQTKISVIQETGDTALLIMDGAHKLVLLSELQTNTHGLGDTLRDCGELDVRIPIQEGCNMDIVRITGEQYKARTEECKKLLYSADVVFNS